MTYQAFTCKANGGTLRELVTDAGVSKPDDRANVFYTKALWDTGATNSVVTEGTAKAMNLLPISKAKVHHADGDTIQNVYLVDLYLPNKVVIQKVRVTECRDTSGKFGLIIGMDVIVIGDFSITNVGGITVFSFRFPSIKTVDFVQESLTPITSKKVGRNEPCPCGSGKKYKHCHNGIQL